MIQALVNQYWGAEQMNKLLTRDEKIRATRTVGKVKHTLDNYLPERTDTLKIACEVCSVLLNELADETREREINVADLGAMDAAADLREE